MSFGVFSGSKDGNIEFFEEFTGVMNDSHTASLESSILFSIAVIIGIVYFVKCFIATGKRHEVKSQEATLDMLKKR